MNDTKITIVGCGLIGGSIALALRRRRPGWRIACLDLPARLPAVREAGVSEITGTPEDAAVHVPESAIVLVATPVQSILETLAGIRPHLREGTIVSDVGSTKRKIMAEARALMPPGTVFIGGHPMAGSEQSGVEAADPLLFSDRPYVLCPYADTPGESLVRLMDLAEDLLAVPISMDPEEHDRIMAVISHLPQLIAVALMHAAQAGDAEHALLDRLAGRGFLDMTRLASSDYGVWKGILETNREAIEESLERFDSSLSLLRKALAGGNAALAWERAAGRRRKMSADTLSRPRKPDLRSMIDRYDKQLLSAVAHRTHAVRKIGKLKMHQAAPVHDPDREKRMLRERAEWGKALGLPQDLIDELFAVILKHSARTQAGGPDE
jgi:prephenate dehydrogenase